MSLSIRFVEVFDYFSHFGLSTVIFLFPILNLNPIFLCGELRSLCSIAILSNCSLNKTILISIEEEEKSLTLLGYYYSTHYPISNISYCYSNKSFSNLEVFISKYYICLYMTGVTIAEYYDDKTENKKLIASIAYISIIFLIGGVLYSVLYNFSYSINIIFMLIIGGFSIRLISLLNKTLIISLSKTLNEIKTGYNKIKNINVILSIAGLGHLSILLILKHFYWVVISFTGILLLSLFFYCYAYRLFPTVKKMKVTSFIFYDSFIIKHLGHSNTSISPSGSITAYPLIPHSTSQESLLSENSLMQKGRNNSKWSIATSYNYFLYFLGNFSYNLYRNYFFFFFIYDNTHQHRNEIVFCSVILFLTELVFHLIGETCFNSKFFLLFNSLIIAITCSIIEYGCKTKKNQITLAMISILLFCILQFHANTKRSMKDHLMKELTSKEYIRILSISSVFISAFMINMVQATNMIMSLIFFTVFIINIKIMEKNH